MKVSELTGAQLDWAVAKCKPEGMEFRLGYRGEPLLVDEHEFGNVFVPSTDWAQGGLIIEREGICITYDPFVNRWAAIVSGGDSIHADTPLIAAMRCYVASKLGDEVEIPKELKS